MQEMGFGERLHHISRSKGMTQAELAAAAKTSSAYISQLETGERNVGSSLMIRIARALHVSIDDLVGYSTERARE